MQEPQLFKCLHPVIKLLASHSGRDKVAKTLHYASRILIWHHTNRGDTARANEVETFRQAIGNSRRVGRFLSSVNAIPTVWRLIFPDPRSKEPNKLFRALLLIANVSDMFYYVSDNLTYAAKYGFIKMSPKTVYFWYIPPPPQPLALVLFPCMPSLMPCCFWWQGGAGGFLVVVNLSADLHSLRLRDVA